MPLLRKCAIGRSTFLTCGQDPLDLRSRRVPARRRGAKDAHGYRRAGHLHHEPSEPAEHSEPAAHGENTGRASHEAHAETLLGINPEATPLVVIAILLSLVLAAAVIAVRSPCCCPASP